MFVDNDLDKDDLCRRLSDAYGVGLTTLTFIPVGESGYSYLGECPPDAPVWVKLHRPEHSSALRRCIDLICELRSAEGFQHALTPLPATNGETVFNLHGFPACVFPYVDGGDLCDDPATLPELEVIGRIVGELHACETGAAIPVETFPIRYGDVVERLLADPPSQDRVSGDYKKRVAQAFLDHGQGIREALDRLRQLREHAQMRSHAALVTHGDPTCGNVLRDGRGGFVLIDWDGAAHGPAERDIVHFTEGADRFEAFLDGYSEIGEPKRLDAEVFAFYIYQWCIGEIGEYAQSILRGNRDERQDAHDWAEFEKYVPISREEMETGIDVIRRVLSDRGLSAESSE
ncbi:hypothetical protein FJZ36_03815 [Candidatus Poribacteria bacterium]|nr:hypothetical protein [Candidatus Poribacteria bacterium]